MAVSLKDVAAHAKVSPATVSGVLNRRSYCWASQETVQRVQRSVKELGYVPNRAARGLRTRKFMTVGLVIPDLANPFNAMMCRALTERLAEKGYSVIIEDNMASLEQEKSCYERIIERQVDGVFLCVVDPAAYFQSRHLPIPTVSIGGPVPGELPIDVIDSDMRPGIRDAISHLVELGHTRIAFFGGRIGGVVVDSERLRIVKNILKNHGLPLGPNMQISSLVTLSSAFETFDRYLAETPKKEHPTAILALNDLLAIAVMGAAQRHGLRVPGDLSVVGMDDLELGRCLPTPLTTISHSLADMSEKGVELIIDRMAAKGKPEGRQKKFPMKFIPRDSTGPAPASRKSKVK